MLLPIVQMGKRRSQQRRVMESAIGKVSVYSAWFGLPTHLLPISLWAPCGPLRMQRVMGFEDPEDVMPRSHHSLGKSW